MFYFSLHIGDYRRDTINLDFEEHGIYMLMIQEYMINEKPFSKDLNDIFWSLGIKQENHKKICENLLKNYFQLTRAGYEHKRCKQEIAKYHENSEKRSQAANKRWHPEKNANAMQMHSKSNANGMLTINHKPLTNNHIINKEKIIKKENYSEDFETFWKAYPRAKAKGKSFESWKKKKPNIEQVLKTLTWQIMSRDWQKGYIPNSLTYINQERWDDEPTKDITPNPFKFEE